MAVDRNRALEAIRLASNAWRLRQFATERLAAGDKAGADEAIELAKQAEAAVALLADSTLNDEDEKDQ